MTARVALIGANGHGMTHRKQLAKSEVAELVALCDKAPVNDPPEGVPVFGDHVAMLAKVKPDVVIVSTPPRTHHDLTVDALRAGADVLLEKPPVLNLAEHHALLREQERTGRAIQVGFQALAAPSLRTLREFAPCDVSVVGAWQRADAYWVRSPWAGRLPLDGALRNPFAHAIMQALAIAGGKPTTVEVAWCRTRDIEVDDTATLRVTLDSGHRLLIAVTLVGEEFIDSVLTIPGRVALDYRVDSGLPLLENLIAHRAGGSPLVAPLALTEGFTAVVTALRAMPRPGLVASDVDGGTRVLPGVNEALNRCASEFALLTEIETAWTANVTCGTATIE